MGPIDPSAAPVDLSQAPPDQEMGEQPDQAQEGSWQDAPTVNAPDAGMDGPSTFLPLTSISEDRNPERADPDLPDLEKNWAGVGQVDDYIISMLLPLLKDTRTNRLGLMDEWRQIRNMKLLKHDENKSYNGRSQVYIPSYAHAADTLVANIAQGLFPGEDYLEAVPLDSQNDEQAQMATDYVKWELTENAQLELTIKPMLREYVDYGVGVGKLWFNKGAGRPTLKRSLLDQITQAQGATYGKDSSDDGIRFSSRSIYHWYVFPWTASNLDEAQFVFEDIEVSRDFVLASGKAEKWKHVEDVSRGGNEPENWKAFENEKLVAQQENSTSPVDTVGAERGRRIVLTEIWASIPMPDGALMNELSTGNAYVPGDDPGAYLPVRIIVAGQYVMSVRRNPMWHQRFPYLVAQDGTEPGAFYTRGQGHKGRALQYVANDTVNQTIDNGTYALNPGIVYNPTTINGELPKIRPGWSLASLDPSQVKFHTPPHEQIQSGERMSKWALQMQSDYMAAPPITQGDNSGGSASTATGAQILQHNANTPTQAKVKDLELQLMMRMAKMVWALGQQYRSGDFIMKVTGRKDATVNADELIGRYVFRWLASTQAANAHQRVAQATQLLAQLIPMVPLIQQAGYSFNPVPLIQKIYQEGLGLRNFDSFIRKLNPQEQAQMQMQQMGAGGGGGPPQLPSGPPKGGVPPPGAPPKVPGQPGSQAPMPTTPVHSANGAAPPQPGEGGPFGMVRQSADAISRQGGVVK